MAKVLDSRGNWTIINRPNSSAGMGFCVDLSIKDWFFDTQLVKSLIDKSKLDNLSRAGARVRNYAVFSIQEVPYGRSAPRGHAPFSHYTYARKKENRRRKKLGLQKIKSGFRGIRHITYGYDKSRDTIMIGPESRTGGDVTHLLEQTHPFMRPALEAAAPEFADMWRDSVRGDS